MRISFQKVNEWTPNISCLIVKSFFNKCELETFKFPHDMHVFQILVFYKKNERIKSDTLNVIFFFESFQTGFSSANCFLLLPNFDTAR